MVANIKQGVIKPVGKSEIKQAVIKPIRKGVEQKDPSSIKIPPVTLEEYAAYMQYSPYQWDPYYPHDPNYPPHDPNYPPQDPNYPPQDPNYPPQDPNYPPQDPNYPPHDPNYPPQYLPNDLKYPPQDPNLVKKECPPDFYPPSDEGSYPYPPPPYPYYAPYPPQDYPYPPGPYGFPPPPPDHPYYYSEWPPMPKVEPLEKIESMEYNENLQSLEQARNINGISNAEPTKNLNTKEKVEIAESSIALGTEKDTSPKLVESKQNAVEEGSHVLNDKTEDTLKRVGDLANSINNHKQYPEHVNNTHESKTNNASNVIEKSNSDKREYSEWIFDDPDLPTGWIIRTYNTSAHGKPITEHQFLSPEQILFDSLSYLIKFMKSEGTFSQESMENLIVNKSGSVETEQMLMNSLCEESVEGDEMNKRKPLNHLERSRILASNHTDWTSDDDTLPPGWKKRSFESNSSRTKNGKLTKYQYLSTNGEMFSARNAVVEHMKKSGIYTSEQIQKVLSGGKTRSTGSSNYTDWAADDDTLPAGWKRRSYEAKSNQTKTGKMIQFQFLSTKEGRIFKGRSAVVDFMKKSGTYTSEEIDKVLSGRRTGRSFQESFNPKEGLGKRPCDLSHDAENPSKQIKLMHEQTNYDKVSEEEALKELLEQSNDKKVSKQKSEDLSITNEDNARENIQEDVNQETTMNQTNSGEDVTEKQQLVTQLLVKAGNNDDQKISNDEKSQSSGSKDKKMTSRRRTVVDADLPDWEVDSSLPRDWKKRGILRKWNAKGVPMSATQYQYLSPTGQRFSSRSQIIAHMKQTGEYTEDEIMAVENGKNTLRNASRHVREIPKLPAKDKTVYSDKKSSSVAKVRTQPKDDKTPLDNNGEEDWVIDDEMLPEGWRKRSFVNKDNVRVFQYSNSLQRTKNGKVFTSTKEVFHFMKYSQTYSMDDALKFLSGVEKQENGDESTFSLRQDIQYKFECNYCSRQFFGENEKLSHQQSEHEGEFRYKCSECGIGDLRKRSLFYHVQSKHADVKQAERVKFDIEIPDKTLITKSCRNPPPLWMVNGRRNVTRSLNKKVFQSSVNLVQDIAAEKTKEAVDNQDLDTLKMKKDNFENVKTLMEKGSNGNDKTVVEPKDSVGNSDLAVNSENIVEGLTDAAVKLEVSPEYSEIDSKDPQKSKLIKSESKLESEHDVINSGLSLNADENENKITEPVTSPKGDDKISLEGVSKLDTHENLDTVKDGELEVDVGDKDSSTDEDSDSELETDEDNDDDLEDNFDDRNSRLDEDSDQGKMGEKDLDLKDDNSDLKKVGEDFENDYLEKSEVDSELEDESGDLENMEENLGDKDLEIEEESHNLASEGWITDPTLPEGCKRRSLAEHSIENRENQNLGVAKFQYLSPDYLIFDSRSEIMDYMDMYIPLSVSELEENDSQIDDMEEGKSPQKELSGINADQENDLEHFEDGADEDMEGLEGLVSEDYDYEDDEQLVNELHEEKIADKENMLDDEQDHDSEDEDMEGLEGLVTEEDDQLMDKLEQEIVMTDNNDTITETQTERSANLLEDLDIDVGPKITIMMKNFEIVSLLFITTPSPSRSMIQDIAESNNMSVKDVKWTFIKLRHKFQNKKGDEINREAVEEMLYQVKEKYKSNDTLEI